MASSLSIALLIALCGPAAAPAPDPRAREVGPFVGDEVAAVAHLDLSRLDVVSLSRRLLGGLGGEEGEEEADDLSRVAARWVASLRRAGAKDLYILWNPADLPDPPVAVVPLAEGADARAIGEVLCGGGTEKPPYSWPTCATIGRTVFAGTADALERARRPVTDPRPELSAAFIAAGDAPAQILILPGTVQRRVLEEMEPTLPRELGGGPIATLTRGMLWASVRLETEPKPTLRAVVQSRDAAAARSLLQLEQGAIKLIAQAAQGRAPLQGLAQDIGRLRPEVVGDRVVLGVDPELASTLVAVPLRSTLESSRRSQCVNNLKQIGLALHNYRSDHKAFPPAFSRDKDGRPLLSWRVLILPYFDQQKALYDEFHLDEPWDSPHNRTLIERMPAVLACPSGGRKVRKAGKTTYLAPRGKQTIFHGGEGVKLGEITDGTSNTIFAVDAADDRAVIWTRPDDWEIDPELKKDGLFGHHAGGTNFSFADGAVRFLRETIRPEVFRKMMTGNGGEVLSADEL